MNNNKRIEEQLRLAEEIQETVSHGKYLNMLSREEGQVLAAKIAQLRAFVQKEFSNSLKDGRMSMRIFLESNKGKEKWELTWYDDGFPKITSYHSMQPLPEFLILPLRAHIELRKRLYSYQFTFEPSDSLREYMDLNPGDGGIEFLKDAGPRLIYPYGLDYYLRFYPDYKEDASNQS